MAGVLLLAVVVVRLRITEVELDFALRRQRDHTIQTARTVVIPARKRVLLLLHGRSLTGVMLEVPANTPLAVIAASFPARYIPIPHLMNPIPDPHNFFL